MFKVGDRVVLEKSGGAWESSNFGKEGVVINMHSDGIYVNVRFDTDDPNGFDEDWGHASYLKLVSENTTFSVPHDTEIVTLKFSDGSTYDLDVKDRARGVPEWVKDGAWVVNKETGDIMRLEITKHAAKAININGHCKWYGSAPKNIPSAFRPFTNSDWKWGMWAEYEGEKVFVMKIFVRGLGISTPSDPYCFVKFSSELTPTTAP